jgi:uncharacterized ion transporter superfamily protein YfcC
MQEKKAFRVPESTVLLFAILIIAALLTFIIPANKYDLQVKEDGTVSKLIDPDSYHPIDPAPQDPWKMMKAIPKGFNNASGIIFFTMFIVGSFSIITATGTIESILRKILVALRGKEIIMISVSVLVFGLIGAGFGIMEVGLVFIPILITMSLALGYDSMVGISLALVSACAGAAAGFVQSLLAIAQDIVGLPAFSGMSFRVVEWIVLMLTIIIYIYFYGKKLKANPEFSPSYHEDKQIERLNLDDTDVSMTGRQKIIGVVVLLGFALLIFGVVRYKWSLTELVALFLSMGIISGIIGGMKGEDIVNVFLEGIKPVMIGILAIGLGRAVLEVLEAGGILHTIVHSMASVVAGLPGALQVVGMYIVQLIISIVIPSGSGMAVVTMPIMGPLASILGITQQTAVIIFQMADCFTNIIVPTSGMLMAALAISKVSFTKWFKWYMPLFLILVLEGAIFSIIAYAIKLGPF